MSVKRGCQCSFVAKQPYLDNSLCDIVYHNMHHVNAKGEVCHGAPIGGLRHALRNGLSENMKKYIMGLLRMGRSPAQVMVQHKARIKELALDNAKVERDTFVLPSDIQILSNKRGEEMWQKHPKDPMSVRMWMQENPNSVFFYQEHCDFDLNMISPTEIPFTIGIQTEWQREMMLRLGHLRAVSCEATLGTNKNKVG